ncbi:hypothetical protein HJC23_011692 [Cyclotella cryptica]|uniref:RelA/SpoT domain-containing protein n=1 Tax=Cyclotella cryptica TaxID=29204 RepID=A0ABD3QJA6_9STRA
MKHRTGNAALISFTAHLLEADAARGGNSNKNAGFGSRRYAPSTLLAFADNRKCGLKRKCRTTAGPAARLTTADHRSASPRYFLDAADGAVDVDVDVLVYKTEERESFSLLKPYLEFNELDLHHLFTKRKTDNHGSPVGGSLYGEFQEVEIGHWKPEADSTSSSPHGHIASPFYFASPAITTKQVGSVVNANSSTSAPKSRPFLPPWLSLLDPSVAPSQLRSLQRDLAPHLSPKQISSVLQAIQDASRGDLKKVAGACDFCALLVNSLEMSDVTALIASAFHYCSLVDVREREVTGSTGSQCPAERKCLQSTQDPDAKYLCALAGSGIESYPPHSMKIALDAARLKSVETLAQSVVKTPSSRIIGDAPNLRSLLLSVNEVGDWRALAIRSAACLYRLEGLRRWRQENGETLGNLRTMEESRAGHEALHIYAPLAARLGMFRLKTELEDAAFRTLYPLSHSMVSSLCDGAGVGEGMKSVLSDISNQMKRLVQEDLYFMEHIENVSITARLKEPYSIWRKMVKMSKRGEKNLRDISILDIPDVVAIRVVFSARKLTPDESDATTQRREQALCYYILDLCMQTWPETSSNSRCKDYVAQPKQNGYQSLHYSSCKRWRGCEWPFEVQIRSSDMHRVAEYGVAAHWSYKRTGIDDSQASSSSLYAARILDRSSESYLRSVQEYRSREMSKSYVNPDLDSEGPSIYIEDEIRRGRKREREERMAPYLEALSGAQTDMTRENVFIFVSVQPFHRMDSDSEDHDTKTLKSNTHGTVLSLPRGSLVLDAIRAADKWFATHANGRISHGRNSRIVLRNGRRTSSQMEQLDNGDVVSILPLELEVDTAGCGDGGGKHFFQ